MNIRTPFITKFDPFERIMAEMMATPAFQTPWARRNMPEVVMARKDGRLEFVVDLPGIPREAIQVKVEGQVLDLSVEYSTEGEEMDWQRRFQLDPGFDPDTIEATYTNGRLRVTVGPKVEAEVKVIEIGEPKQPEVVEIEPQR